MELTNADRERAVGWLWSAARAGALSRDDFEARVQAVYVAKTQHELDLLLTPRGLSPAAPGAPQTTGRRPRLTTLALIVVAIVAVLAIVVGELHSRGRPLTNAATVSPAASSPTASSASTVPSSAARSLLIKIVPPGAFAKHDRANQCGSVGAPVMMGNRTVIEDFDNCYLVIKFTNIGPSSVEFIPAQLKMNDYDGNSYTTQSVNPSCYDTLDINAPTTLEPHRNLTLQICYPVATGELPEKFTGFFTLAGVNAPIPSTAVVGTWGGT